MKGRVVIFLAGWAALLAGGVAEEAAETLLPSQRDALTVETNERNPFAKVEQPKPVEVEVPVDSKSEESRIEAVLSRLTVLGRARGASGWRVLLGDMILEVGKPLPPVIEGQTLVLRVAAIHDAMVEIEWESKDPGETSKRTFIPIQLRPVPTSALGGQRNTQKEPTVIVSPPNAVRKAPAANAVR
jgi:hypothetical protein